MSLVATLPLTFGEGLSPGDFQERDFFQHSRANNSKEGALVTGQGASGLSRGAPRWPLSPVTASLGRTTVDLVYSQKRFNSNAQSQNVRVVRAKAPPGPLAILPPRAWPPAAKGVVCSWPHLSELYGSQRKTKREMHRYSRQEVRATLQSAL